MTPSCLQDIGETMGLVSMMDCILAVCHSDIRFDDLKLPCLAQDIGETMG
jgi:hypothetical protein